MSNSGPTITVTRGSNRKRRERDESSGNRPPASSGLGLPGPGALVSGVVRGVRNAWWVGLGVVAETRDAGVQVFDALVEEGKSWERAQRERREETARRAQQLVDENEAVRAVEDRVRTEVNNVLQRVGVPHREEVDELRAQIDALSDRIEHLAQSVEDADSYS